MATKLRALKINEVSLVDRPANPGARVLLAKRAVQKDMYGVSRFADLLGSLCYLMQSSENEAEYEGDGSPVPASLRTWLRSGSEIFRSMAQEEVDELITQLVSKRDGQKRGDGMISKFLGLFKSVDKATEALAASVKSIVDDKDAKDKPALIDKTIEQFAEHVETQFDKALTTGIVVDTSEDDEMSAALKKALGLADTATEADLLAEIAKKDEALAKSVLDAEIAKANMSADEKAFHDGLKSDDERKAFRAQSSADRTKVMTKRDDIPEYVKKQLAEAEDLKKRLAVLEDERELESFKKRAAEIGLPASAAETLMKAKRGDAASIDKVIEMLGAANAAIEGSRAFEEFGTTKGATGNAYDQLEAKAQELRKREPKLTQEQAFAKVYEDPANRALVTEERRANRPMAS